MNTRPFPVSEYQESVNRFPLIHNSLVGSIISIDAVMLGVTAEMSELFGSEAQLMVRQADIADTSLSAIDERVGDKNAALPEVQDVSGLMFTATMHPESGGFFVLQGYEPRSFLGNRIDIVEGEPLTSNHEILLGRTIADAMTKKVGDTMDVSGYRYRVVGIYESKIGWEEVGRIITLRDPQVFMGRLRKVTLIAVRLKDPRQAVDMVEHINREFPDVHAALSGNFGGSGTPTIQMLLAGKVDYAIVSADEVVIAHARGGSDIVAVFATYQINPQGIMTHAKRGFKSIGDLMHSDGVLLWQSGLPYAQYLKKKYAPLTVITAPYLGGICNFQNDPEVAQQCFVTSEPLTAAAAGIDVKTFLVADSGYNPYTSVLVTSRKRWQKSPAEVKSMVDAVSGSNSILPP